MSASDSLVCFTSDKIDFHPCPNCRAPMLVRSRSAGMDASVRKFECYNCDNVSVAPADQSEPSLYAGAKDTRSASSSSET